MKPRYKKSLYLLVAVAVVTGTAVADEKESVFQWNTVINNDDFIPFAQGRTFNSYNPPSVNTKGMVVVRARSRGGPPLGPATHGIYMRDMGQANSDIVRVLDRTTFVPEFFSILFLKGWAMPSLRVSLISVTWQGFDIKGTLPVYTGLSAVLLIRSIKPFSAPPV